MPNLEDYMKIVEDSHEKTASASNSRVTPNLLEKLAEELGAESAGSQVVAEDAAASVAGAAPASADAQGGVQPAASSVAGANPAVVAATDAVAVPQEIASGAAPEEKPAGEMAAPIKPNESVVISAADGAVSDANTFSKDPAAVAAAAEGTNPGESEKTAELRRAKEIGVAMAHSFHEEMNKIAENSEVQESVGILKEAGLLDGYKINV